MTPAERNLLLRAMRAQRLEDGREGWFATVGSSEAQTASRLVQGDVLERRHRWLGRGRVEYRLKRPAV